MQHQHLGSYGVIIKNQQIVLIKKSGGPYDGKLDLPGGTIEFGESPKEALIRELNEEVGIQVVKCKIIECNSIIVKWIHKNKLESIHHIGIFYKIDKYNKKVLNNINISEKNDDSMGADFYDINKLHKKDLSSIAILILEKMKYKLLD